MTAKLNMADGVRGGISVDEALPTAKWLEEDGGLDAIELTAGSSLVNPMYLFRGDAPVKEFAGAFKPPLRWGIRMTGKKFMREYPYREAYLLRDARLFRAELKMPLILLGGITNRETMDLAMAEGFDFVAMGRALLAEPDLINRIQADGENALGALGLHPLQQVHGHHLQPHPLRRDRRAGRSRQARWLAAANRPRPLPAAVAAAVPAAAPARRAAAVPAAAAARRVASAPPASSASGSRSSARRGSPARPRRRPVSSPSPNR